MNQLGFTKQSKARKQLLSKDTNKSCAKTTELILLDQLVQVDAEQFKDETQVLPVNESIFQPQQMMIVVLVHLLVQL